MSLTMKQHPFAVSSFYLSCYFVCIVFASATIVLNSLFLTTITFCRNLRSLGMKLLMCLACIDLTQGLLTWPLMAYTLLGHYDQDITSDSLISVLVSISYQFTFATVLTIFLIALEQFTAVVKPFFHQRHIRGKVLIIPALMTMVFSCTLDVTITVTCQQVWPAFANATMAISAVLFFGTIYFYCCIWRVSRKISCEIQRQTQTVGIHSQQQTKAAKTSIIILFTFALCYFPKIIYDILQEMLNVDFLLNEYVGWPIGLLALTKSVLNPLIYYWRLRAVRKGTKRLISKVLFCLRLRSDDVIEVGEFRSSRTSTESRVSATVISNTFSEATF